MPKPLMFGDGEFDAKRVEGIADIEQNWDYSYVPGYSETRRRNEMRVRDGKEPIEQPRLQWVRTSRVDGKDADWRDFKDYAMLGYQFVTKDDFETAGITGMPPAAHEAPDGTIRREDLALAFVDAEQARKNKERQERKNALFHGRRSPDNPNLEVLEDRQFKGSLDEMSQFLDDE